MVELQMIDRGNRADYVLGTELGWAAFDVVRWHGVEGISRPFEHDIILARSAEGGPVEIHELVDTGATFRVATEARWRNIHGIVAEAELLESTPTLLLYRVLLVPQLCRASHRRRCRTFVDQSLAQIIAEVLENRAPKHPAGERGLALLTAPPVAGASMPSFDSFVPPGASYRWALTDPSRLERARPFVVQYNELDLDFLARLLEAEGVSYFFEHGATECVLTLTDRPGHAPLFFTDEVHALVGTMQAGATRDQEVVRAWRPMRRLRSAAVTMRDYAWRKSLTLLEASAHASDGAPA
jgi:type VI secretion system secreted protein VgrG